MQNAAQLELLLGAENVNDFFEKHWNKRALYIPGNPSKFEGLFSRAAFETAAQACTVLKVGYTDERGWPAEKQIQTHEISEMLASGKTVCAGGVETGNPELAAFLRTFASQFVGMGKFYFNSYLSPDGAGFGLHLDDHPVWILQIDGSKRWWFSSEPGLDAILTTVSFPRGVDVLKLPWATVQRPDESTFNEVVLRPGDALYMPKGTWHRAAGVGCSLALTLAELCATPVDLLQFTLGPRLSAALPFRDPLPVFWNCTLGGGMPPELQQRFTDMLKRLQAMVGSLSAADLYEVWQRSRVVEAETPKPSMVS